MENKLTKTELELQSRFKSPVFWFGLIGVAVQGAVGVLLACGALDEQVAGALVAALAAVEGYAVGNNPSLKGV